MPSLCTRPDCIWRQSAVGALNLGGSLILAVNVEMRVRSPAPVFCHGAMFTSLRTQALVSVVVPGGMTETRTRSFLRVSRRCARHLVNLLQYSTLVTVMIERSFGILIQCGASHAPVQTTSDAVRPRLLQRLMVLVEPP